MTKGEGQMTATSTQRLNSAGVLMWFYGALLVIGIYVYKFGIGALLNPAAAGLTPDTWVAWGVLTWLVGTYGFLLTRLYQL